MHDYEKTFQEADEGKKGYLNCDDVKIAVMLMFGHKISKSEAVQLLTTYGSRQKSGDLGFSHLQFKKAMIDRFIIDKDEEIRSAFMMFDRCCQGFLTMEDVKCVFRQVCPHFAEHRLEMAFRELDCDGDGRVSYKDFDFMMKFDHLS